MTTANVFDQACKIILPTVLGGATGFLMTTVTSVLTGSLIPQEKLVEQIILTGTSAAINSGIGAAIGAFYGFWNCNSNNSNQNNNNNNNNNESNNLYNNNM